MQSWSTALLQTLQQGDFWDWTLYSGEVHARSPLDREHKERYEFRVTAADKGVPSHRGTATVVIKRYLIGMTTIPSSCWVDTASQSWRTGHPLSPVGMVTVQDMDKGENAQVQLFVESDVGKFVIQNGTGTILSSISFDREKERQLHVPLESCRWRWSTKIILCWRDHQCPRWKWQCSLLSPNHQTHPSYVYSPMAAPDSVVEVVEAEDIDSSSNAELVIQHCWGKSTWPFLHSLHLTVRSH